MKEMPVLVWRDNQHAIVVKPAGMSTHGRSSHTLDVILRQDVKRILGNDVSPLELRLMNRLDHGTRGLVVVAWTKLAIDWLQAGWSSYRKTYHAWVVGDVKTVRGTCRMALEGQHAESHFLNLGSRPWPVHGESSLLEWTITTGRTHQIRRHAAAMGHPVVGDPVYGHPPLYHGKGLHLMGTALTWVAPGETEERQACCLPSKRLRQADHPSFDTKCTSPFIHLFQR